MTAKESDFFSEMMSEFGVDAPAEGTSAKRMSRKERQLRRKTQVNKKNNEENMLPSCIHEEFSGSDINNLNP